MGKILKKIKTIGFMPGSVWEYDAFIDKKDEQFYDAWNKMIEEKSKPKEVK